MKMTISGVLYACIAMISIAYTGPALADTCPKGSLLPIPDNVKQFQQQVRAALRSAIRGKSDSLVVTEIRDIGGNLSANAMYCAKGEGTPLAITVEARFSGSISIDDGKKAMGLIDIRDREREIILKTPPPPEMLAESARLLTERETIREQRKREFSNSNDPRYKEASEKMYQLQLKSEQITKPHKEAMEKRVREEVNSKYQADIDRLNYAPSGSIEISANNYDFQNAPTIFFGAKGRTNTIVTRVRKIAVDLRVGTTNPSIVKVMQDAAASLIDSTRLQAIVDGKIPSIEESNALFAQQSEDMKIGNARKQEADKAYSAIEADARRARQAERAGKPASSQASTTSTATAPVVNTPAQSSSASTPAPPQAQAQQQTQSAQSPQQQASQQQAPQAPAITPTNVINGLNQLKGLFGR